MGLGFLLLMFPLTAVLFRRTSALRRVQMGFYRQARPPAQRDPQRHPRDQVLRLGKVLHQARDEHQAAGAGDP